MKLDIRRIILGVIFVFGIFLILRDAFTERQWGEFTSSEGAFSVLMPGIPDETEKPRNGRDFSTVLYTYSVEPDSSAYYGVSYYDIPPNVPLRPIEEVLNINSNGMVKGIKGELLSENSISLNGHPGRELMIKAPEIPMVRGRLYFVDRRIYVLMAITSKAEASENFMNSFKLLN